MDEKEYLIFRKIFYWFFVVAFFVLAPLIVLYSLGYKFNVTSKKFQRTGAVSIRTVPREAAIFLNGHNTGESSPCVLRELLPGDYTLEIEKKGYYPYKLAINIASSSVHEVEVTLLAQTHRLEKLTVDLDVYRFFLLDHLFDKKLVVFADKGIYSMEEDFSNPVKLAGLGMDASILNTIEGLRDNKNRLAFWSQNEVWLIDTSLRGQEGKNEQFPQVVYVTKESIKDVYFGLNRYLIISDGMRVVAVDIKNPSVSFPLMNLQAVNARIFYDSSSDTIYVRDRVQGADQFSLFRMNLRELVHDKGPDQKGS